MATILVSGGGGYVGSHACKALFKAGHVPVTFDNFSTGWRDAVQFGPVEEGDLRDRAKVAAVMQKYQPDAVFHIAALSDIAHSMSDPEIYRQVNVMGSINLLQCMAECGISKLVFSSTCAVYDASGEAPLTEATKLGPQNVYGETKAAAEKAIASFGKEHGIRSVVLRYFNVAGADVTGQLGEFHRPETHLIPRVLQSIENDAFVINGDDFDTPDGTCVRDYVHVADISAAHLAGLDFLEKGNPSATLNLGSGLGYSVREVVQAAENVTGRPVPFTIGRRRNGDVGQLVCNGDLAKLMLGWHAINSTLEQMIFDAWNWHQKGGFVR